MRRWKRRQAAATTPERERDAQAKINKLNNYYDKIAEKTEISARRERMYVSGFKPVKAASELKSAAKDGIIITDKQIGKKSGKHMTEWNLNPSNEQDRKKFAEITNDIHDNADEVRRVPWKVDKETGKRTVKVNAFIKGRDVVLVDDSGKYITTMKDGIENKRIKGGETL